MLDRNNLDKASSPYLRQHKDNPVHWQEWSDKVLADAKKNDKPLFVSVGYSTCHWCHVMAAEAFSDPEIADYLNRHFASIKVDREQRPDIDQFLMSFVTTTQGHGGWPLNAFLTPGLRPFFAGTYFPVGDSFGRPGFLQVLKSVRREYDQHKNNIQPFTLPGTKLVQRAGTAEGFLNEIASSFNSSQGGFGSGTGPQFPPHSMLLFLLNFFAESGDQSVAKMISKTIEEMAARGLHDHLQGGFYRYCVDGTWTIPHFEKMLYDQAMMLWVYSTAYKLLGKTSYKTVVEKLVVCLEETFENNKLFYSAYDADTKHKEGATYLWSIDELQAVLTKQEYQQFAKEYLLTKEGNFEGKNHLIKKRLTFLPRIEMKLLAARKKRLQPFVDRKVITSWNALAGIGLMMAYRFAGVKRAGEKALVLFKTLLEKHYLNGRLVHSSLDERVQREEFLEDYAAILVLATFVYEENGENKKVIQSLYKKLQAFQDKDGWHESNNKDFMKVAASTLDQPIPSSGAVAEWADFRVKLIFGEKRAPLSYQSPLSHDFFNMVAYFSQGNFHEIDTPKRLGWKDLPINSMQILSDQYQDCYHQTCTKFSNAEELTAALGRSWQKLQ